MKYDRENAKPYDVLYRVSEPRTSHVGLRCPFCKEEFKAYIWSINGCGKKCPGCGALHGIEGTAQQVLK